MSIKLTLKASWIIPDVLPRTSSLFSIKNESPKTGKKAFFKYIVIKNSLFITNIFFREKFQKSTYVTLIIPNESFSNRLNWLAWQQCN